MWFRPDPQLTDASSATLVERAWARVIQLLAVLLGTSHGVPSRFNTFAAGGPSWAQRAR